MTTSDPTAEATSRTAVVAAVAAVAAVGALHFWLSANAAPPGFASDDSLYLLMAEWFAGVRAAVVGQVALHTHLPPLYPIALAAVGAAGDRPLAGHLLNALLTGATLFLTWQWLRLRQPVWLAAAAAVLTGLAPGMLLQSFTLWSEPLYTALSMAVLLLLARGRQSDAAWLVAAMLLGLAFAARLAAITLVLAVAFTAFRQRPRRPLLLIALALLPVLAWKLFAPAGQVESGYLDLLGAVLMGTGPVSLGEVLSGNLIALWQAWIRCFELLHTPASEWLATVALLPVLGGWLPRLRRGECDAVYVLLYLGMLMPWPATADHFTRFLLPLLPLAAAYAGDAGLQGARRLPARQARIRALIAAAPLGLLALVSLPSLVLVASRIADPPPAALASFHYSAQWMRDPLRPRAVEHLDLRASAWLAARALRDYVPEEACLQARPVQFFMLHARRETWLPAPPVADKPPRCRYVFAGATADGSVIADGVASGSRVLFAPTRLMSPATPIGILFEAPRRSPPE